MDFSPSTSMTLNCFLWISDRNFLWISFHGLLFQLLSLDYSVIVSMEI